MVNQIEYLGSLVHANLFQSVWIAALEMEHEAGHLPKESGREEDTGNHDYAHQLITTSSGIRAL